MKVGLGQTAEVIKLYVDSVVEYYQTPLIFEILFEEDSKFKYVSFATEPGSTTSVVNKVLKKVYRRGL